MQISNYPNNCLYSLPRKSMRFVIKYALPVWWPFALKFIPMSRTRPVASTSTVSSYIRKFVVPRRLHFPPHRITHDAINIHVLTAFYKCIGGIDDSSTIQKFWFITKLHLLIRLTLNEIEIWENSFNVYRSTTDSGTLEIYSRSNKFC